MSTYDERILVPWYAKLLESNLDQYLGHMFTLVKIHSESWDHNYKVVLRDKPDLNDFKLSKSIYPDFGIERGSIANIRRDLKVSIVPDLHILGIDPNDFYLEDAAQSIKYNTVHKDLQDILMASYPPFSKQLVGDLIQYADRVESVPTAFLSLRLYKGGTCDRFSFNSKEYKDACIFVLRNQDKFEYNRKVVGDYNSYRGRRTSSSSHEQHEFSIKISSVSEEDLDLTSKALRLKWKVTNGDLRDIRIGIDSQAGENSQDINDLLRVYGVEGLHMRIDEIVEGTESVAPGYSEAFYGNGHHMDYKRLTRLITGDQAAAYAAGRVECEELTRIAELSLKYGEEAANKILDILYGDYKP